MKFALMTAIYDGYDTLKDFTTQDVDDVEAICVTDDPLLHSEQWNVVYEPRPWVHPNRAAKSPKMCPWRYTDADVVVWADASLIITCGTRFAE